MSSWYKIRIPIDEHSDETAFRIDHACEQRKIESGSPPDFVFFGKKESDSEPNLGYIAYYFSPTAFARCADLLGAYNPLPCDKPT